MKRKMINAKQKAAILEVAGKPYNAAILKYFSRRRFKNDDGKPFADSTIRQVVCGHLEHKKMEALLLDFAGIAKPVAKKRSVITRKAS